MTEYVLRYMGRGKGWQCRSKHGDRAIVGWGSRVELALRDYRRQAKCFPNTFSH